MITDTNKMLETVEKLIIAKDKIETKMYKILNQHLAFKEINQITRDITRSWKKDNLKMEFEIVHAEMVCFSIIEDNEHVAEIEITKKGENEYKITNPKGTKNINFDGDILQLAKNYLIDEFKIKE